MKFWSGNRSSFHLRQLKKKNSIRSDETWIECSMQDPFLFCVEMSKSLNLRIKDTMKIYMQKRRINFRFTSSRSKKRDPKWELFLWKINIHFSRSLASSKREWEERGIKKFPSCHFSQLTLPFDDDEMPQGGSWMGSIFEVKDKV